MRIGRCDGDGIVENAPPLSVSMEKLWDRKVAATNLVTALFLLAFCVVPAQWADILTDEDGVVEWPAAIAHAIGALICMTFYVRTRSRKPVLNEWSSGAIAMLAMCLRELDFQKSFTPATIESTHFYLSQSIPWKMKLIVLAIIVPVTVAVAHLLWLGIRHLPPAFREGRSWARYAVWAAIMLVASRVAEKSHVHWLYYVEETLETTFAVFLVWTVLAWAREDTLTSRGEDS
jgi:succinate dehydrogenase/fumarate reductase cytochrome b subunit